MTKKVIYIAGPFRGKNAWEVAQNVRRAEEAAFDVATMGAAFICPHLNSANFDGTLTDEYWLDMTLELMRRCDAVYVLDRSHKSAGTRGEVKDARRIGLPVIIGLEFLRIFLNKNK